MDTFIPKQSKYFCFIRNEMQESNYSTEMVCFLSEHTLNLYSYVQVIRGSNEKS